MHEYVGDIIPAVLCIDAEPDHLQIDRAGVASWAGVESMFATMERLRPRLFDVSGAQPRFWWGLRMDPQIEVTHGRADYLVSEYAEQIERLSQRGDTFGVHPHALRWSDQHGGWIHDFADREWVLHCVDTALDAFRGAFGEPALRHRLGGHFFADYLVEHLEHLGVRVDLTVQAGQSAAMLAGHVATLGAAPDVQRVPCRPYRPSARDFRRPARSDRRSLVMVPLSSARYGIERPLWWRATRALRHGLRPPLTPLWPSKAWRGPQAYWDEVEQHLDASSRPYLAIAARTDEPDSLFVNRVIGALEYLPEHSLARRLRFVDPLDLVRGFGYSV
jgi:hypothetical protein